MPEQPIDTRVESGPAIVNEYYEENIAIHGLAFTRLLRRDLDFDSDQEQQFSVRFEEGLGRTAKYDPTERQILIKPEYERRRAHLLAHVAVAKQAVLGLIAPQHTKQTTAGFAREIMGKRLGRALGRESKRAAIDIVENKPPKRERLKQYVGSAGIGYLFACAMYYNFSHDSPTAKGLLALGAFAAAQQYSQRLVIPSTQQKAIHYISKGSTEKRWQNVVTVSNNNNN